jgi:cation diffusion facilitator family transporter
MTRFLVRLFVKNSNDIQKAKVRTAYGVMTSIVGIVLNILLFTAKFLIGFLVNSISVTADAFNNLSDAASSLIGLIGVKLANRPADREHPFGHGRYEYITALIVAFLVLQVGFNCFQSSLNKIFHPEATDLSVVSIVILCVSISLKAWLSFFNRKIGKKVNSSVMKATATDALGDVLITSTTVISLLVGHITGLMIDGYVGVGVSVFVLIAGINIARDTFEPLLGKAVNKETFEIITQKVLSYPNIVGTHDLIVHSYGPSHTMATVHCEVPNNISIEEAHEVIDCIERDVARDLKIFLVIHMDPIEIRDEVVNQTRSSVTLIVHTIEAQATIHDFRMVNGENQINLIFDLVVPHGYQQEKEQELRCKVIDSIQAIDERFECVITIENSYINMEEE